MTDVAEGVRLVDEEQFGPALPVISYRKLDDAVERANRTTFGLSGSVWSESPERAAEVAGQLECGTAWVNQHLAITPFAPFGGAKWSGHRRRERHVGPARLHRDPDRQRGEEAGGELSSRLNPAIASTAAPSSAGVRPELASTASARARKPVGASAKPSTSSSSVLSFTK